jgi:hypothetical protein
MRSLARVAGNMIALLVGIMVVSAGTGLLLGLAWLPAFSHSVSYKVISLLLAMALALVIGGWLAGLLVSHGRVRRAAALGLFFGILAFGYIFGPNPILLLTVPLTALLAAVGGWLANRTAAAWSRTE